MLNSRSSILRLAGTLLALAFAALCGGCYGEGGPGFSDDAGTYVSRPWHPVTITLKDTRTGQDFWSIDVPVGKKLMFKFYKGDGTPGQYTPDNMNWGLFDEEWDEWGFPTCGNNLPVPPWNSRRIDVSYRPAPELPESMIAATRGSVQPAKVPGVRPPNVTVPAPTKKPVTPVNSPPPATTRPAAPAAPEPPLDLPDTKRGS